ncbi:MAG: M20 family metallopeptidase [Verrucomicrobia bacterium]|nr:M20 family metallopeptidase [Verrucomicrobiota bacterium]
MPTPRALLRELVALPSVNPAFLPKDDPRAGEQRVAHWLASVAADAGLDVALDEVFAQRPNLHARLTPTGRIKHRVILAPHLDTVGILGTPEKAFTPEIKRGRLHGRGACDTKGSVTAMLSAVMAMAGKRKRPAHTEILFLGLIDEEKAQEGSRHVARSKLKADLAIVGEPTRNRVVTAHKGGLWLVLKTVGKSAHGSTPKLGKNAVHEMARIVDLLETEYADDLSRRSHPLLGSATVNVGAILGGSQPNIVPASCSIQVDRRTLPGESLSTVKLELAARLRSKRLSASLGTLREGPCPALETDFKNPWVQRMMQAAGQSDPQGVNYFCDAAVLAMGGIPSIVYGPGDIAQAHTADEWIDLDSLDLAVRQLTRFLESLP